MHDWAVLSTMCSSYAMNDLIVIIFRLSPRHCRRLCHHSAVSQSLDTIFDPFDGKEDDATLKCVKLCVSLQACVCVCV